MRWPWSAHVNEPERNPFTAYWGGSIPDMPRQRFQADGLQADDALLEILAGLSSARVSRRDALSVPAVLKARNMIAGIAGRFPIHCYDKDFNIDERNWIGYDMQPQIPDCFVYAATIEDLLFESKSYWRVDRMSGEGFPVEGHHVNIRAVSQHAILGMPSEIVSEDLQFSPRDPIFIDGLPMAPFEVIRFVSPNPPLLVHAARAIRTVLLLDKAAELMAGEPVPLGYFTDREDADPLEDTEVTELLNDWAAARRTHSWGYVPWSLDLNTLQWTPEQLQLAQARQHAVLEIARAVGLDPMDMGVDTTSSHTYQNVEQRRFDLVDLVHSPYLAAIEQRLSKNDVLPRGIRAEFDVSAFLRADTKTRFEAYRIGIKAGAVTVAEVRRAEHRPPLSDDEKAERKPAVPPVATTVVNAHGTAAPSPNGNGKEPVEVA